MAPPIERYFTVDHALSETLSKLRLERRGEVVAIRTSFGRVSAADVLAPSDVPEFASSHWDGFAVRAGDLKDASDASPASLRVVGKVGPGSRPGAHVGQNEAVQVATGAPLPSGADTVVPIESVMARGRLIIVKSPPELGSHIYRAGEDIRKGESILRKGQTIRAQDVGLLLALGFAKIRVWRKPVVSVIATGSELTESQTPEAGRVVNSHSPIFLRLCEALGCTPMDMGIARDAKGEISRLLRKALSKSDFVLTLGGTSAGRRDLVTAAVSNLNPELMIHGLKMDRGRVTAISITKGKPILMMPGPIQGAMNAFLLLGVPVIAVLSGRAANEIEVPSRLSGEWEARKRYSDFTKVVYVKLRRGEEAMAEPLSGETESIRVLAEADGFVVVPQNVTRIGRGNRVMVTLLPGLSFA